MRVPLALATVTHVMNLAADACRLEIIILKKVQVGCRCRCRLVRRVCAVRLSLQEKKKTVSVRDVCEQSGKRGIFL